MMKHTMTFAAALVAGTISAQAESMISPNGLKASESAVTVNSVVADKAGYVVIHSTDITGTIPGTVVGHASVKAGDNAGVSVPLDKKLAAGTKLIVMLHEEGDNNTAFDAADKPATAGRGPVQQFVTVQ